MAVNIGPKIGIDGEAEYRKEIQAIIQQAKTLSAETNETAAAFKNANDKEKAGAELTKKLNEQISNQKALVKKLEDAVRKSTEKTGENSTQTQKWKEQLAKAKTELLNMEASAKGSTAEVRKLGDAEERTGQKTSVFGQMLKANLASAVIQKGLQATAKIVKDLSSYFVDAVKSGAEYADEVNTLRATTGMSTDAIQEWKYVSKLIDVEFSTIEGSLTKLTKNMGAARDGSAKQVEAFKKIGVSVVDANGKLKDSNVVFDEVIIGLRKIPNETERDAIAMDILGKSAKDLNPLIKAGAGTLDELRREAHKVGAVLDHETLNTLNDVQDGFDRLGLSWDAIKRKLGARIGAKILPDLDGIVRRTQILSKTGDPTKLIDGAEKALQRFINKIPRTLSKLSKSNVWNTAGEDLGKLLGETLGNGPKIIEAGIRLAGALLKGFGKGILKIPETIGDAFRRSRLSDETQDAIDELERVKEKLEDIPSATERIDSDLTSINGKQKEAEYWVKIFDELSKKTEPTATDTERLNTAAEHLNEIMPGLGLAIDAETGKWNMSTEAIKENLRMLEARARAEAYYSAASDTMKEIAEMEAARAKSQQNKKDIDQQIQSVADGKRALATQMSELLDIYTQYTSGVRTWEETQAQMQQVAPDIQSFSDWQQHVIAADEAIKAFDSQMENLIVQQKSAQEEIDLYDASIKNLTTDVDWFFEQGSKWEEVATETKAGMQSLQDIADQEMERLKETIRRKKREARNESKSVGNEIAEGVTVGISDKRAAVIAEAGSLVSSAIARMKMVAQIKSPSRKTRDLIGKNLALGVVEGYEDVIDAARTRRIFSMTPVFDSMTSGGDTITNNNNNTTTNFGGVSVNVYARDGESANSIADAVMRKIQSATDQRKAVFA